MTDERLRKVFAAIVDAVKRDPELARKVAEALGPKEALVPKSGAPRSSKPAGRRKPASLDPFAVHEQGEETLRAKSKELDVEALNDIVAEHSMDPSRLVLRWKTPERIIDHIASVVQRGRGEAMRSAPRLSREPHLA